MKAWWETLSARERLLVIGGLAVSYTHLDVYKRQRQILVAPGEAVTLHRLALPSRKRSTWARVVPFALEDYLVEDIETLHFALGGAVDSGYLPVAVVDRTLLSAWLEGCEAAGLTPAAVVPDPLLLPWQSDEWSVLLEARRALVRTCLLYTSRCV